MSSTPVLYQETRLTVSSPATSILHINTSGNANTSAIVPFGAGRKRTFDEISGLDEESYARKHLATEGSLFFRPKSRAPRTFLWRVLNDRQLLEVQCIDLVLEPKHHDADSWLTFNLTFPAKIIPGGVALADAQEKDALDIFVLTAGNELYTITLKRDLLVRQTVSADFDSATCVKRASPSSFSYKHPYRLVAANSRELLVSMHDGSIVRMTREKGESGAQWRETHFSEGGWSGTLKRSFHLPIIKPRTVRYGTLELFQDAIAAISKSPDGKHIWTVGLDHVLKAWSGESGKVVLESDLLQEHPDNEDRKKLDRFIMSPEQGTLLQIVPPVGGKSTNGADYLIVVHSPKDHQIKIYAVRTAFSSVDGESIEMRDVHPSQKLIPPVDDLMNANIWHLEKLFVDAGPQWRESQLWLRARSGAACKTFTLNFDLLGKGDDESSGGVGHAFSHGWTVVNDSSLTIEQIKNSTGYEKLDGSINTELTPSERWIEFLFYPGRFSLASLETALHTYRKGRNLPAASNKGIRSTEEPLKERITTAIAAKIVLPRLSNEQPDYDSYQAEIYKQWETFFSLLSHLHTRRHENIGLALDFEEGLPWTICADFVAPIRTCSAFELFCHNAHLSAQDEDSYKPSAEVQTRIFTSHTTDEDLDRTIEDNQITCRVLAVARQLRLYFSPRSQESFRVAAAQSALDQTEQIPAEESLQSLYGQCNFQDEVRDDEYNYLNAIANEFGGLSELNDDYFLGVLECIDAAPEAHGASRRERLARYGEQMTMAILQETVSRNGATLLDLLALLVFLRCDLEQDEVSPDLRSGEVYESIMLRLRQTELRRWLLSNIRQQSETPNGPARQPITLYESLFAQDWEAKPSRDHVRYGMPELLTAWSKHLLEGLLISDWPGITEHILMDLLKHKDYDLAMDFVRFLTGTPWHMYLRGRLYLATGEYALASIAFRERAQELAYYPGRPLDSFFSAEDVNYFGRGETPYFQHIASLFEKLKIYSYTADFASLALANVDSHKLNQSLREIDRRKGHQDSPMPDRIDDAMDEIAILKTRQDIADLYIRLFNARVQIGQVELAFDVLKHIDNPALQRDNLKQLLQTCVKRGALSALLALPIRGELVAEADAILLHLAKKSMAAGLPSGPQYHQILFAFRTQHADFRGAAAILYEHLEHLRKTSRLAVQDPEDETLVQLYVLLINTLASCKEGEGWLLADPIPGIHGVEMKRKLVTLEDVRREYNEELDRRSDLLQGRFPVVANGDEMEIF